LTEREEGRKGYEERKRVSQITKLQNQMFYKKGDIPLQFAF
jgi:hypothetical protein